MPNIHLGRSGEHGVRHARRFMKPSPLLVYFVLAESVFWATCAVLFIFTLGRIGTGIKMTARMKALKQIPDAFTDEEREALVRKIKTRALGPI